MPKHLGLDLSTQSLTALIIDPETGSLVRHGLNFDRGLPAYGTREGVPPQADPTLALVDPLMWAEALDRLLLELGRAGLTSRIAGLSISAQQHGSVYLNAAAPGVLASLDPARHLHEQVAQALARPVAPIWMDSSTSTQCAQITRALGGAREVTRLTGSPVTERFAAPQARKFWQEDPEAYTTTAHLALVSSFATSLLTGGVAPLDCGDGLGMNLADASARRWSPRALEAAAPGLGGRLPELWDRDRVVRPVSAFAAARYGLPADCLVTVGTGDNPASLAGLGLVGDETTRAISLGTSDTYFGYVGQAMTDGRDFGHLFGAADGGYMFLVCFKNGSPARERIRQRHGLDWPEFSRILENTQPGNQGRILLPWFLPEITPVVLEPGARRYGGLAEDDAPGNVRAVAEAQVMSMYLNSAWAGPRPSELVVTAGGSANRGLIRLIAQVFGARVRVHQVADSAALGAALRSLALEQPGSSFAELARPWLEAAGEAVEPDPAATRVYQGDGGLIAAYAACQEHALDRGPDPAPALEAFRRSHSEA